MADPAGDGAPAPARGGAGRLVGRLSATARAGADHPAAAALPFAWGAAEALWWPIMPDLGVALLALSSPRRWWRFAAAGAAGSVAGGALAYRLGARGRGGRLPLVTPRMVDAVDGWLRQEDARAVRRQPLSGVPFKVFAYRAGAATVPFAEFQAGAGAARGLRLLGVAAAFGGGGRLLASRVPERLRPAAHALACGATVAAFAVGLAGVVRAWSGDGKGDGKGDGRKEDGSWASTR